MALGQVSLRSRSHAVARFGITRLESPRARILKRRRVGRMSDLRQPTPGPSCHVASRAQPTSTGETLGRIPCHSCQAVTDPPKTRSGQKKGQHEEDRRLNPLEGPEATGRLVGHPSWYLAASLATQSGRRPVARPGRLGRLGRLGRCLSHGQFHGWGHPPPQSGDSGRPS